MHPQGTLVPGWFVQGKLVDDTLKVAVSHVPDATPEFRLWGLQSGFVHGLRVDQELRVPVFEVLRTDRGEVRDSIRSVAVPSHVRNKGSRDILVWGSLRIEATERFSSSTRNVAV